MSLTLRDILQKQNGSKIQDILTKAAENYALKFRNLEQDDSEMLQVRSLIGDDIQSLDQAATKLLNDVKFASSDMENFLTRNKATTRCALASFIADVARAEKLISDKLGAQPIFANADDQTRIAKDLMSALGS